MDEVIKRVTERDAELPHEVMLHYLLYCLNLKSGKVEWTKEFYKGRPPGGRHRKNSFVSESPVTAGKFVYVYVANWGYGLLTSRESKLGHTPSKRNPIYLDFGTGSSPALAGTCWYCERYEKPSNIAALTRIQAAGLAHDRDLAKGQPPGQDGRRLCLAARAAN